MKRKIGFPILIALLIALDQLVKWYTVATIPLNGNRPFIPSLLSLSYLRNYGAAYSLFQNQQVFFLIVTVVVMGAAIYYMVKEINHQLSLLFALSLLIAGGLGNFIDRIRLGYVVDMFQTEFINFPVFNVADSFLTIGVAWLFWCLIREEKNGSHR